MSNQTPRPGDALVRAGAVVFLVGALATLATVVPLFLGVEPLPTAAYLVSMLMGVGFALALGGLLRSARAQRRSHTGTGTGTDTGTGAGQPVAR